MRVISLLISSPSFWVFLFVNVLGGAAVAIGLWGEGWAERRIFREIPSDLIPHISDSVRRKRCKRSFERLLLGGVVFEVIAAVITTVYSSIEVAHSNERAFRFEFAAKQLEAQIAQTSTNVVKIDPRNLPIVSLIARVCVVVKSPSKDFANNMGLRKLYLPSALLYEGSDRLPARLPLLLAEEKEMKKQEMTLFDFGKNPKEDFDSEIHIEGQVSAFDDLVGDWATNADNIGFELIIKPPQDNVPVFNPDSITFNELKYVHFSLPVDEMIPPVQVVRGQIELLINGFFPKIFLINPQTNQVLNIVALETKEYPFPPLK